MVIWLVPILPETGIMLNITINILIIMRRSINVPLPTVNKFNESRDAVSFRQVKRTLAMTMLTAGPARATQSSCMGLVGILSNRATCWNW